MLDCMTLLCVYNQTPEFSVEDYFVAGVLVFYVLCMLLFLYLTWRGVL